MPLSIFLKRSIIDVWQSSEYASSSRPWQTKIIFIIFWDFLMYKIFLSPKVKRWAIITYKHGIYEFSHELPNNLRFSILGN